VSQAVIVDKLSVHYTIEQQPEPIVALDEIDLSVKKGELVTIIGPSGCGKSTLLHTIGGLISPTSGSIHIDGTPLLGPDPKRATFVFQEYTLLPWKNLVENVALGLKFAGIDRASRTARAMEQLKLMRLEQYAHMHPDQVSGGMQQRVAVARALAMEPQLILMDEPFGALDEQTRMMIGAEISRIFTLENRSALFVTHSLDEAVFLADRVILLTTRPGRIKEEIIVDEPRPRTRKFLETRRFVDIRSHLFASLDVPAGDREGADT